jgi:hypothetical protein
LKEGNTVEKLKKVIDVMVDRWSADPKMKDYLRPSTLFNREKFAQYAGLTGGQKPPRSMASEWENFGGKEVR